MGDNWICLRTSVSAPLVASSWRVARGYGRGRHAFAMPLAPLPAQLWAEGAEGIAEAVAQAATPGEDAAAGIAAEQRAAPRFRIPRARLQLVPPQQRQQLATKARRRGAPAASERSLRRHPLAKQDLPPRLPSSTENPTETGDVAKKQVEVSFSIIGTDADGKAQTWVAPTQLKLDEGRDGCGCLR